MAWYNLFSKKVEVEEKLNPAQVHLGGSIESSREPTFSYERSYEQLEIVNRAVNMSVDDAAEINLVVGERTKGVPMVKGVKREKVNILLNTQPNLFQDISTFRRNLYIDMLLDGNIFIYFDGAHLYHLPASKMKIHSSTSTYIEKYTYNETIDYSPSEIIHVKDNSFYSMYRGVPRLRPALRTIQLTIKMREFQDNFFKNGAVPGLVLKSPNTLSEKIKERMIQSWMARYRPDAGGRRPMILDGGLEVEGISNINFKELDFQNAITENEKIILKALGVPPILLDSGNNANIRPNMRLYYLETILPMARKLSMALERFFGYDIMEDLSEIPALQPELRDQSQYYTSLTNAGLITVDEARVALGFEPANEEGVSDILRIPANIAGSAANPDEGGRPPEGEE